jgi:DivIVA domain-containing protein
VSVQQDSIERIRNATFSIARKGYEKREVERFLGKVADWLEAGGGDRARSDLVKRELERVGEKTAGILASAEDSAEQLRSDAEREATATLERAREQAAATRQEADAYSSQVRSEADTYADNARRDGERDAEHARAEAETDAREALAKADAKARRIVGEGMQRRSDLESVISDLVRRRDAVLADVDELSDELKSAVTGHTPAPGADPFERPEELDPEERDVPGRTRNAAPTHRATAAGSGKAGARRGRAAGGDQVRA